MLVADIAYSTSGLVITLIDASLGTPTSWAWSIAQEDGTEVASGTDSTLSWTFTETGQYLVTLVVQGTDEEDSTATLSLLVDADAESVLYDVSILSFAQSLIPTNVFTSKLQTIKDLKTKWQLLLYEALNISPGNTHNEDAWPVLANILIAYLIARDIVILEASNILIQTSSSGGGTKKIVTGPTEAEKFAPSEAYKELFGEDKAYESFQAQICGLALRLGVYIFGCPKDGTVGPLKVYYTGDYAYEHKYILNHPEYYLNHNNVVQ